MSRLFPLVAAVVTGAALVLLAGCSAVPTASDSPTTGGTPSAAAPTSARSTSSAAAGICGLVPLAAAENAVKPAQKFTDTEPGTFVNGEAECGYASQDGQTIVMNVMVFDVAANPIDAGSGYMSDAAMTPVAGIGDRAEVGGPEFDAVVGTHGVVVETFGTTDLSLDQLTAMGRLVVSAIR